MIIAKGQNKVDRLRSLDDLRSRHAFVDRGPFYFNHFVAALHLQFRAREHAL